MTTEHYHTDPLRTADGWDILDRAAELSRGGVQFAIATVVWRQSPSSGRPGSRAIITGDGALLGWIGGACAEPVVIREAQQVIRSGESKLLLLGTSEQFGGAVPDGIAVVPIACQSEGALEIYIEPVLPTPQLIVVGRSPMAHTLVELATALGWRAEQLPAEEFTAAEVDARSVVVVATQGHGDEEAVSRAVSAAPAFVGLVASRRRGEAVLGYLAQTGVPQQLLDRVQVPVGLDLGHTSHREIAVAVLAQLVQLRASGALFGPASDAVPVAAAAEAIDPVCGMTVTADESGRPYEHEGTTYWFCCPGCRRAFAKDPAAYLTAGSASEEARC